MRNRRAIDCGEEFCCPNCSRINRTFQVLGEREGEISSLAINVKLVQAKLV